jgi:hypothetical protein
MAGRKSIIILVIVLVWLMRVAGRAAPDPDAAATRGTTWSSFPR